MKRLLLNVLCLAEEQLTDRIRLTGTDRQEGQQQDNILKRSDRKVRLHGRSNQENIKHATTEKHSRKRKQVWLRAQIKNLKHDKL